MSGFVGWKLKHPLPVDPLPIQAAFATGTSESASKLPANEGLIFNRARDPITAEVQAKGWAVVDGRPRWLDRELAELARRSGDAAAAVAAYKRLGVHFTEKIGGSYALAVADRDSETTVLAVDRFGTRPLAFHASADGFVFGSTVEGLRRHPRVPARIDPQAVYNYFFFHVVPSPQTIYRGIEKVEPGQTVIHSPNGIVKREHWRPDFSAAANGALKADAAARLPIVLESAVRRCEPRQGFGAYLSGGLDSSAVSGLLSKAVGGSTPVYCVGFAEAGYDEMGYARITAKHFGLALREIYATPDEVADVFDKVAAYYDEPFGNSSAVPAYLCARRAAEDGVHNLLAGDGGDELFGGNDRYVRQRVFEHYWRLPQALRGGLIEPLVRHTPWLTRVPVLRKVSSYVIQASMPMPDRTQSYNLLQRIEPATIFERAFLDGVDTNHPIQLLRARFAGAGTDSLLSKMLYLDWKFTLADNDLRKVNGSAELADVSVLYPMLDDEVVDLSIEIPDREKILGGDLRKFYKDALASFLPKETLTKTKHGFGLPFGEWLNKSPKLRDTIFDSLTALRAQNVVRKDYLDSLVEQHRQEHAAYYGGAIWVFAMFSRWLAAHDVDV